ncbi:carboxymuconolactone decarboxylase family protein [Streptomyces sp. NPDC013313]|uniref:carboxymuconolactone decarboxylase family protein n=1 Tax=unclassified Streptomyces TaxID=2593676 RepID=UPI0033FF265C
MSDSIDLTGKSERYKKGIAYYESIHGAAGARSFDALEGIAPGFADLLIEFTLGDIHSRPGLDVKTRELITVAALTAMGTANLQLKTHVDSAMNVGWTKEEIIETITQMAVYAGFPAALNGFFAAAEVFAAREAAGQEA